MKERKETISPLKANLLSFVLLFVATIVCGGLFVLALYLNDSLNVEFVISTMHPNIARWAFYLLVAVILVVGMLVHELIHGIAWAIFAKNGFKSISFGANWRQMILYCHCSEPLKVRHYAIGALAPLFILGIIPAIVGIIILNPYWELFGIAFIACAIGDIMVAWKLRKENPENTILDHPSEPGYLVYEPEEEDVKE